MSSPDITKAIKTGLRTLNAYQGLFTATLTIFIVVFAWLSATAARDAARAARDQVSQQTFPLLTGAQTIKPFTYGDGLQFHGDDTGPFALQRTASRAYLGVAVHNDGPGYAVIYAWRALVVSNSSKRRYETPFITSTDPQWLIEPGKEAEFSRWWSRLSPEGAPLWSALATGQVIGIEFFYKDLAKTRDYETAFEVKLDHGRVSYQKIWFFEGWKAIRGFDSR